jgi:hypothetical protein
VAQPLGGPRHAWAWKDGAEGRQLLRPGRGTPDEAAVQGCLDHMEPPGRLDMVGQRIDDRALLHLSRQWLKAGMLDPDGPVGQPATGTPPGGTVSAVLANVYLHYALALWVEQVVKPHCRGAALLCREADAWVWAFRLQEEVERFCRVLPQRFAQFNLQVAPQKTHRHRCSRVHPSPKRRFTCLGCECFWRPDRHGVPASCGAPHARRSQPLAHDSRNGANNPGTCRGGHASSGGMRADEATSTMRVCAGTHAHCSAASMGRWTVCSNGSTSGEASGGVIRGSSVPTSLPASR